MYEKRRVKLYFKIIKWVNFLCDGCACIMILFMIIYSMTGIKFIWNFVKIGTIVIIILNQYTRYCPNCGEGFGKWENPEECSKCGLKLL